mmetsp:Transcript_2389/g.4970  ORF Transcript_2389/g.4970 Transcript_2389/m.4970 type:complete len:468 (+) Transcript_2389:91-1494(+)
MSTNNTTQVAASLSSAGVVDNDLIFIVAGSVGGAILLCVFLLCCSCGLCVIFRTGNNSNNSGRRAKNSKKKKKGGGSGKDVKHPSLVHSPPTVQPNQYQLQNPQPTIVPPQQIMYYAQPQPRLWENGAASVAFGADHVQNSVVYPSGAATVVGTVPISQQAPRPQVIFIRDSNTSRDTNEASGHVNHRSGQELLATQSSTRETKQQQQLLSSERSIASSQLADSLYRLNETLDRMKNTDTSSNQQPSTKIIVPPVRRRSMPDGFSSESEYNVRNRHQLALKKIHSSDGLNAMTNGLRANSHISVSRGTSPFQIDSLNENDDEEEGSLNSLGNSAYDEELCPQNVDIESGDARRRSLNHIKPHSSDNATVLSARTIRSETVSVGSFEKGEIVDIHAPPGILGLILDLIDDAWPVVHAVKQGSVVTDCVEVGDRIISIDGNDIRTLSAVEVSKMMNQNRQETTMFTVLR